ncbi:TetR/AcrR family transcriptional regulator [Paenibacillus sp. GCM10012303]|uniref:TetR/AcrR family transcriptional regulator n=1 Tax=Paenibacillus sp. GCM10012303 TaxID=3317340 RepID=UPI003605B9FF
MPREKGQKGKESRSRLLNAAAEEFAVNGFHETKVSSIVAAAGMTQPAFYLYFQSKEAVFEQLVGEFRSGVRQLLTDIRMESGLEKREIPERAVAAVEAVFRYMGENASLTRIGLILAPEAESIKREFITWLAENLLVEQQAGYFRSDLEMDFVAECLYGMIERLAFTQLIPGIQTPQTLARQMACFILPGMAVKEDVR